MQFSMFWEHSGVIATRGTAGPCSFKFGLKRRQFSAGRHARLEMHHQHNNGDINCAETCTYQSFSECGWDSICTCGRFLACLPLKRVVFDDPKCSRPRIWTGLRSTDNHRAHSPFKRAAPMQSTVQSSEVTGRDCRWNRYDTRLTTQKNKCTLGASQPRTVG